MVSLRPPKSMLVHGRKAFFHIYPDLFLKGFLCNNQSRGLISSTLEEKYNFNHLKYINN